MSGEHVVVLIDSEEGSAHSSSSSTRNSERLKTGNHVISRKRKKILPSYRYREFYKSWKEAKSPDSSKGRKLGTLSRCGNGGHTKNIPVAEDDQLHKEEGICGEYCTESTNQADQGGLDFDLKEMANGTPELLNTVEFHPRQNPLSSSVEASRRNRKRVQYYDGEVQPDETLKKQKKMGNTNGESRSPRVFNNVGKESGIFRTSPRNEPQMSSEVGSETASTPKSQTAMSPELHDQQRSLHQVLKPDMAKLFHTLGLKEDIQQMAEQFFGYMMTNQRVIREPDTALQAFQISVCWIAASILGEKLDHVESLSLAREHLNFNCNNDEAEYAFSKMQFSMKMFIRSEGVHRQASLTNLVTGLKEKVAEGLLVQEDLDEQVLVPMQTTEQTEERLKYAKKLKKKCKKKVASHIKEQRCKVEELEKSFQEKRAKCEKKYKHQFDIICKINNSEADKSEKLKNLEAKHRQKLDQLDSDMATARKGIETIYQAKQEKTVKEADRMMERFDSWIKSGFSDSLQSKEAFEESGVEVIPINSSSMSENDLKEGNFNVPGSSDVQVPLPQTPESHNDADNSGNAEVAAVSPDKEKVIADNGATLKFPPTAPQINHEATISANIVEGTIPVSLGIQGIHVLSAITTDEVEQIATRMNDLKKGNVSGPHNYAENFGSAEVVAVFVDRERVIVDNDATSKFPPTATQIDHAPTTSANTAEGTVPDSLGILGIHVLSAVTTVEVEPVATGKNYLKEGNANVPDSADEQVPLPQTPVPPNDVENCVSAKIVAGRERFLAHNDATSKFPPTETQINHEATTTANIAEGTDPDSLGIQEIHVLSAVTTDEVEQIATSRNDQLSAKNHALLTEVDASEDGTAASERCTPFRVEQLDEASCSIHMESTDSPSITKPPEVQPFTNQNQVDSPPAVQEHANSGDRLNQLNNQHVCSEVSDIQNTIIRVLMPSSNNSVGVPHNASDQAGRSLPPEQTVPLDTTASHPIDLTQQRLASCSAPENQLFVSSLPCQTVEARMEGNRRPLNRSIEVTPRSSLDVSFNPALQNSFQFENSMFPRSFPATVSASYLSPDPVIEFDPLQRELSRMNGEFVQASKTHEHMISRLKMECDKEIEDLEAVAQIRRKYGSSIQEADASFSQKKSELEHNKSKVVMNFALAEAFRAKCACTDPREAQQAVPSNLTQQLIQSQFGRRSNSPAALGPQTVSSPATQNVNHSTVQSFSTPGTLLRRSGLPSSTGNQVIGNEVRVPPTILESFNPSMPVSNTYVHHLASIGQLLRGTTLGLRSQCLPPPPEHPAESRGGPHQAEASVRPISLPQTPLGSATELLMNVMGRSAARSNAAAGAHPPIPEIARNSEPWNLAELEIPPPDAGQSDTFQTAGVATGLVCLSDDE